MKERERERGVIAGLAGHIRSKVRSDQVCHRLSFPEHQISIHP